MANQQMSNQQMNSRVWINQYPKGVQADISFGVYKSLQDVFAETYHRFPNRSAFKQMNVSLTYLQLHQLSDHLASFFQNELSLKKGDRLAIQLPNLLQYPVILAAAFKVGLVVVNTNPLYTAKEMLHQFKDSGAKSIIILANFAHLLEKILPETSIESVVITEVGDLFPFPKNWVVNSVVKYLRKMVPPYKIPNAYGFRQAMDIGMESKHTLVALNLEDPAFLQYTGGTTGVSKGAVLLHKNVLANMLQIHEWMKPLLIEGEEVAITALPLYHIFSLTVNCLSFMKYGATNVLIMNPRDIPAFIEVLRTTSFSIITGVNTLYNALMNHSDFEKINFKKAKIAVAGAMALQSSVAEKWKKKTGFNIFEGYGLTEASPVVCCNPIVGENRVGTIGLPLPSTFIKIMDESGKEVSLGESGELWVKGPQVMKEYWNQEEETKKVFDDNGWLKTGDVALLMPDGYVRIVDRKKDMILVSGFNVYPNEVEDIIATHPGVLEVAVVGIPDDKSGEVVKAFVVKKDPHLTEDQVILHAKGSLTGYKVPKQVEFRTELPKTSVGKMLRRALRDS